jgi:hypothetical protein
MKIAVYGRHPDLEHGFNGLMSINWLKGFYELGCEVTLYIPDLEHHKVAILLGLMDIGSLDDLPRYGAIFDIKVANSVNDIDSNVDAVIWQSYRPQEEFIRKQIKDAGIFIAKNPPGIMSGDITKDFRKVKGMSNNFDLIGTSLKSDFSIISRNHAEYSGSFAYVPRGFNTDLLQPDKTKNPSIGFDKAVKGQEFGYKPIDHIVNSGQILKENIENIEYYSLRDNVESLNSMRVPNLPFNQFYKRFVNKIWIYMPINFDYSVHSKGKYIGAGGRHKYIGLYENQIIETQLAGGLILVRKDDIPPELLFLEEESQFESSSDVGDIVAKLMAHIENFSERSKIVRTKALETHSYLNATRVFLNAISSRL